MRLDKKLGFLGYGNMGAALFGGLVELGMVTPKNVYVFDPLPKRAQEAARLGGQVVGAPEDLPRNCDILIIAVKPQQMEAALQTIKPAVTRELLIISIAAGVSINKIQAALHDWVRVARVMPNTPYLVHAGAAGIAPGTNCTPKDIEYTRYIFNSIGVSVLIDEALIDAVTALSGSGPAYCFYMVECLVESACRLGLDRADAEKLAAHTLFGAGKLLVETGESPAVLRQRVSSPGGTTEAALKQLESDHYNETIQRAVEAAFNRSRELRG